ncbi:regulator of G protein signaling domain protein [Rhizoctonia solani]|uniref:Regulator of G protein signaling domain protein n=1 Tax=Rhizoctonia solani TaxID=456999 RepID=A0A8H8T1M5_9AGAM|nr:regulator of G protein signaling domain protein [Rhizoctonia solani]QRW25509.1 regulator of G protein signaling domain protein [Rhizoctonia solani]
MSSLAPPQPTSPLRVRAPQQHGRPEKLPWSFVTFLKWPARVFSPPKVSEVKGWSIIPTLTVTLEDMLKQKHLPPISLKDFEEYLLFEEFGAENLYFLLWLQEYSAKHRAWFSRNAVSDPKLAMSFTRAKATFFSRQSSHELNLAAVQINNFFANTNGQPHPVPAAFDPIKADVETSLRESLKKFLRTRICNADSKRATCVWISGVVTILTAVSLILLSVFSGERRRKRIPNLSFLWLGMTIFLCSWNGLCLVIYLCGGGRQLRPFELARPSISAPLQVQNGERRISIKLEANPYAASAHSLAESEVKDDYTVEGKDSIPMSPTKPSPATLSPRDSRRPAPLNLSAVKKDDSMPREPASPQKVYIYDANTEAFEAREIGGHYMSDLENGYPSSPTSTLFETAPFIPVWDGYNKHNSAASFITAADSATLAETLHSPRADTASTFSFDFDALPGKHSQTRVDAKRSKMREIFSPLTRIHSPVVSRAQWHIVMRSASWAMLFALAVTGAALAIPVQGGKYGVMF